MSETEIAESSAPEVPARVDNILVTVGPFIPMLLQLAKITPRGDVINAFGKAGDIAKDLVDGSRNEVDNEALQITREAFQAFLDATV